MDKHLIFAYFDGFRQFKDTSISFDSRFEVRFEDNRLIVSENKSELSEDFWGNKIECLSCIVGDNGAGKTSIIKYIVDKIVEGKSEVWSKWNDKCLLVFTAGEKYHQLPSQKKIDYLVYTDKEIEVDDNVKILTSTKGWNRLIDDSIILPTVVYCSNFNPQKDASDPLSNEVSGMRLLSDGWLLYSDIERVKTIDRDASAKYASRVSSFVNMNHYRVIKLLQKQKNLFDSLSIDLPPIVRILAPDQDRSSIFCRTAKDTFKARYFDNFMSIMIDSYYSIPAIQNQWTISRNTFLADLSAGTIDLSHVPFQIKEEDFTNQQISAQDAEMYVKKMLEDIEACTSILSKMEECCSFDDLSMCFYISVDNEKLDDLLESLLIDNTLRQYVDVFYSHDKSSNSQLSAGESMAINLFSRLYDALEGQFGLSNDGITSETTFVALDEAEVGFHPEWQRNFISLLVSFFESLPTERKYQIVLTTHSPIILSDIPRECCNFIKKEKKEDELFVKDVEIHSNETFGANIFDLYKDSFFMSKGLVGKFAEQYIRKIESDIKEYDGPSEYDLIRNRIEMIGDAFIRNYLHKRLDDQSIDSAIKFYSKKIKDLESKRRS